MWRWIHHHHDDDEEEEDVDIDGIGDEKDGGAEDGMMTEEKDDDLDLEDDVVAHLGWMIYCWGMHGVWMMQGDVWDVEYYDNYDVHDSYGSENDIT